MHKNILIISPPFRPNIGGVETHLDDLIKDGVKQGLKFTVITYQPLVTKAVAQYIEKGKGYKIIRIPWPKFGLFLSLTNYPVLEFLYLFPGLFFASLFYLLFVDRNFGVIHAQGLVAGTISIILSRLFNKKTVLSTHSIYNFPKVGLYRTFVNFIFSQSQHILTLSKKSKIEVEGLGLSPQKVTIFTYWVDQTIFKPMDKRMVRKSLNIPSNAFVCLFVGRLVPGKGVHELVEAAMETRNIIFLIVGDGPLRVEIEKNIFKNDNIKFIGKVENNELPKYYNAADVLMVPSTHEEGFGRVILEALSCGLPIVGSKQGSIPEAVNGNVAVLIDISSRNIRNALLALMENRQKLSSMARASKKFAMKKYSKRNIDTIISYY